MPFALPLVKVVVTQQMQHGVDGQIAQLPGKAVAVFLALGGAALQGEYHIPQGDALRFVVIFAGSGVESPLRQLVEGEGEHVRGAVYAALIPVDGMNPRVVGQHDADLAVRIDALGPERGAGGAAGQLCRLRVAQAPLLPVYADLVHLSISSDSGVSAAARGGRRLPAPRAPPSFRMPL